MNTQKSELLMEAANLTKVYPNGDKTFMALKGVDLKVKRGEYLAIVGHSGSGKSTLLNMITGIDRPTEGRVIVNGEYLDAMSERALCIWRGKNVGVVFQFFQLIPTLTILENTMLPMDFCNSYPSSQRKKRAEALLERVGILQHKNKLPSALSGGEQQRAAIARALANNPPIVVADEPTGNLDSTTSEIIFGLFDELIRDGKSVVLVTHSHQLAQRAQRIIEIRDGAVVRSE